MTELVGRPPAPMQEYRTTPAPPQGEDPGLDALANAVCQTGGHIPNRDRRLPDACDFHRRMAYGYVRVLDCARPDPRAALARVKVIVDSLGDTEDPVDALALWEDLTRALGAES